MKQTREELIYNLHDIAFKPEGYDLGIIADFILADRRRLVEPLVKAKDYLYGVLCDPEGYVCIQGSDGDRECAQKAMVLIGEVLKNASIESCPGQ